MSLIKNFTITADEADYDLLAMPINPANGVPYSVTRVEPGQTVIVAVGKEQSLRVDVVVRGASSPTEGGLP